MKERVEFLYCFFTDQNAEMGFRQLEANYATWYDSAGIGVEIVSTDLQVTAVASKYALVDTSIFTVLTVRYRLHADDDNGGDYVGK